MNLEAQATSTAPRPVPHFSNGRTFAAPSVHKFRVPYARALYAAAIAALLSACTSAELAPATITPDEAAAVLVAQDESTDMPVIVVTATRTMPEVVVTAKRTREFIG